MQTPPCCSLLASNIQATATAAGCSSSATLQQLQTSEPGSLLEGLLAASPGMGLDAQGLLIRALGDDSAEVRRREQLWSTMNTDLISRSDP